MRNKGTRLRTMCRSCGKDVAACWTVCTVRQERQHRCPHKNVCPPLAREKCTACEVELELRAQTAIDGAFVACCASMGIIGAVSDSRFFTAVIAVLSRAEHEPIGDIILAITVGRTVLRTKPDHVRSAAVSLLRGADYFEDREWVRAIKLAGEAQEKLSNTATT